MQFIKFGYLGKRFSGAGGIQPIIPTQTLYFKGQPLTFKGQYITFKQT